MLAGAAAIVTLGVLMAAVTRPVIARMALRGALRRRGETLLVVLGSLLGTAIITGSLIVGDTLDGSIRAVAPEQLGPVDLVVNATGPQADDAATAVGEIESDRIDGTLSLKRLDAAIATPDGADGDERLAAPAAQLIEVDFADARAFGDDPATTGISGATPKPGHAVIGADLAAQLEVDAGNEIEAFAYGQSLSLVVDRVLERTGIAGFSLDQRGSLPMNAFVAPGTLEDLAAEASAPEPRTAVQVPPPQQLLLVSAAGGVFEGAEATDEVTAQLEEALSGVDPVAVEPVKQDVLEAADEAGDAFSELFLSIGAFAVLAGVLLLINIFVMLAEERKPELGMMRAIGLRRRDLVRLFVVEGGLYSVAAAALGAVAGIGVGRAIVAVTSEIFSAFGDGLSLRFVADASSVTTGFLAGLLIGMATVAATSIRISRINIIRAIRDLPEPTARTRNAKGTALLAVAAAASSAAAVAAIASRDALASFVLPALAGLFLALLLARFLPRRPVVSLISLAVLVWAVFGDQVVDLEGGDIVVFVAQGMVLVFSAVALVAQNQESIGRALRALSRGRSLVTRLGLAYPLARRFRTAMTLGMYSLVVFTLVFLSVLSQLFGTLTSETVTNESGGYEVLASASPSNPPEPGDLATVEGVRDVARLSYALADFAAPGATDDFQPWAITGVDQDFVDGGPPPLEVHSDAYADPNQVWDAVLADESLVVVDAFFLQEEAGVPEAMVQPGARIEVRDPVTGEVSEREVVAVSRAGIAFSGVMASKQSVAAAVSRAVPQRYYIDVADDADPQAVAERLQGAFVESGLQASSFREIVELETRATLQFFYLMQGYLMLGLVVGIAGLGVVMVRAVRERRRQIGMLRSLGLQAGKVRAAFLLESGFVAAEGILIGTALALVTAYQIVMYSNVFSQFDTGFAVPWDQLAIVLGTALVGSLVATAAPAQRASRTDPAVALRIAD